MAYTTCPDCGERIHRQYGGNVPHASGPHYNLPKFGITLVGKTFYKQCFECKLTFQEQIAAWENEGGKCDAQ